VVIRWCHNGGLVQNIQTHLDLIQQEAHRVIFIQNSFKIGLTEFKTEMPSALKGN
jgi:hypothetical protein